MSDDCDQQVLNLEVGEQVRERLSLNLKHVRKKGE